MVRRTHLADDLGGLRVVDSLNVLRHGVVVIALLIEVVTVLSINDVLLLHVHARFLGKVEGERVEIALIEQLQPVLQRLLVVAIDLTDGGEHVGSNLSVAQFASYLAVLHQDVEVAPYLKEGFDW